MSELWAGGNGDMGGYFEERCMEGRVLKKATGKEGAE